MPLTDTAIRQAKPGDKARKLADEKGLYQVDAEPSERTMKSFVIETFPQLSS